MNKENVLKWYINLKRGAECDAQKRLLARLERVLIRLEARREGERSNI